MLKLICALVLSYLAVCGAIALNETEEDPFIKLAVDANPTFHDDSKSNELAGLDNVVEEDSDIANPYKQTLTDFNYFVERNGFNQLAYVIGSFRKVNWYTAQLSCAAMGLSLASVNNARVANALRNFIHEHDMTKPDITFWLSGTDLAERRNFHWFTSGRPMIYENWAANQPTTSINPSCIAMDVNGQWKNMDCNSSAYFICENQCSS